MLQKAGEASTVWPTWLTQTSLVRLRLENRICRTCTWTGIVFPAAPRLLSNFFFADFFAVVLTFPRPHWLPLGLRRWSRICQIDWCYATIDHPKYFWQQQSSICSSQDKRQFWIQFYDSQLVIDFSFLLLHFGSLAYGFAYRRQHVRYELTANSWRANET